MANFTTAIPKLIRAEGGYRTVNNQHDLGGETYAGISRRAHPHWEGWALPDANRQKKALARQLYREHYWDKICGDAIDSQVVAESLFFWVVLSPMRTVVRAVQRLLGVETDGIIGMQTAQAINDMPERLLLLELFVLKIRRRVQVSRTPQQIKWLRGWINRALKHV